MTAGTRAGVRRAAQNHCHRDRPRHRPGSRQHRLRRRRRRDGRLVALDGGVVETAPGSPPSAAWPRSTAPIAALIDEHEPDAMALEELYFGQNAAQRLRRRPGAGRRDARRRPARPALRRLHAPAGQGRRLRQRPSGEGPGRADGRSAARPERAAAPRPRGRRARRGDLPRQPRAAQRRARREPACDRAAARRGGGAPWRPRRAALRQRRLPGRGLGRDAAPCARRSARR